MRSNSKARLIVKFGGRERGARAGVIGSDALMWTGCSRPIEHNLFDLAALAQRYLWPTSPRTLADDDDNSTGRYSLGSIELSQRSTKIILLVYVSHHNASRT